MGVGWGQKLARLVLDVTCRLSTGHGISPLPSLPPASFLRLLGFLTAGKLSFKRQGAGAILPERWAWSPHFIMSSTEPQAQQGKNKIDSLLSGKMTKNIH